MTYEGILGDLKKGNYAPIYLLHGEESYYIDKISSFIEKEILEEGEKAFNLAVLYGKEVDFKRVVDEARQFPMMSRYRVIVVKEAQDMRTLKKIELYAEKPSPQSIVVLCHKNKKVDKRNKYVKNIGKSGVVFESKKIYDNQLPGWISSYARTQGFQMAGDAAMLAAEYLGADLNKVSNEIDKLTLNIKDRKSINLEDVQNGIGISKDYNVFEFQKALGMRDGEKAFRIVNYFSENQKAHPLTLVIGNLYNYFNKLYALSHNMSAPDAQLQRVLGLPSPYFVKDYKAAAKSLGYKKIRGSFEVLKKADLASKGYGARHQTTKDILTDIVLGVIY